MNQVLRLTLSSLLFAAGLLSVSGQTKGSSRALPGQEPQHSQLKITPQHVAESADPSAVPTYARRRIPGVSAPFASAANGYTLPNSMRFNAPRKAATPSGGTLRGVVLTNGSWDFDHPQYGVYEYPLTAGAPVCTPVHVDPQRLYILNGVYMGDTFWGAVPTYNSSFDVVNMVFYTFDTNTWEVIDEQPGDRSFGALDMTWDPVGEKVYAVSPNYSTGKASLSTYNTQYGFFDETIGSLPDMMSGLAANAQGELYGITVKGKLYKIDKTDGTSVEIGDTGLRPYWASSAAIDPKTGLFYYALELESRAEMYEIDPETAVATKLYDFENNEQIFGMYIHHETAAAGAPSAAQNLALAFDGASLEGTVSFTVPSTLFDGSNGVGSVTYTVKVDDEVAVTGDAAYGSPVNLTVTVAAPGVHTVSVVLSNNDGDSPATKASQWIGSDVPSVVTGAKATYADGVFTVSWTGVTSGVNGGYFDADAVTYKVVRYPDEVVVAENTSETSLTDEVAEPTDGVKSFYYTITALFDGASSEAVSTSKKTLGYVTPPYLNTLDSSAEITGFTVLDSNGDGKKWGYNSASGALRISYNSKLAMDDWVFSPEIMLEAGKMYQFSFKASCYKTYAERVEAGISTGTKVSDVVAMIIEPTDVNVANPDGMVLTGSFIPETSGRYRFAIHGISDKDKYYLYVDDISVSAGIELAGPAGVENLTATRNANGELEAVVKFNAPVLDLAGQTLTEIDRIELKRGDALIKTFENPQPGEELTFTDTEASEGNNTYTVTPYGVYGEGEPKSVSCFVGFDKPVAPEYAYAMRGEPGVAEIEWAAVTEDLMGNPVPESKVSYNLYMVRGGETSLVAGNLTQTAMSHRVCADTDDQEFVYYVVTASIDSTEGAAVETALVPVGAAYGLPFNESFANGRLSSIWGTLQLSATGSCMIGQDTSIDEISSYDGDNGLFIMQGLAKGDRACIYSGVINITDVENPTLSIFYFNYACNNTVDIQITDFTTGDGEVLASVPMSADYPDGWRRLIADMSKYVGHDIQVLILGNIVDASVIVLDNLSIYSASQHDLSVKSVSMPGRVAPGVDFNVAVTVENLGLAAADSYTVSLYRNGEVVATETGANLAAGTCATVTFAQIADIQAGKSIDYNVVVSFAADEVADNNESQHYVVKLIAPEAPAVADLAAAETAEGVSLQWSAPDLTVGPMTPVTDDLSDYEPFSIGLATTSVFDDYIGNWTMVDGDGLVPYNITSGGVSLQFPNVGKPVGFIVMDSDVMGEAWEAKSGRQMFVSLASGYGPNDDWMISPRLSGEAQTISFYAKSIHPGYIESFEFYTSADLPILGAFRKMETVAKVPADWTLYTYELPAGTSYFAIHCVSDGMFALCVDEITYTPESPLAGLEVIGYNVYRNGVKVNSELVKSPSFLDTEAEPGNHVYTVSTVYNRGESARSNEASVVLSSLGMVNAAGVRVTTQPGVVIIEGAQGRLATVAAPDGKLLFNGVLEAKTVVEVPAGVCIVKVDATVVKVSVK